MTTIASAVFDEGWHEKMEIDYQGIQHVLVNGVPVVKDGELQSGVNPGRAVRAPIQTTKID